MDQINQEGCGYIAVVNNIFVEFEGREDEFEKRFGFPMYNEKGELNYDYLIVDMYAETDDKYFINDPKGAAALVNDVILSYKSDNDEMAKIKQIEFRKKYGCELLAEDGTTNPETRQKVLDQYANEDAVEYKSDGTTTYSLENRLHHYLNEKGVSYTCDSGQNLSTDKVNAYLENGQNVKIGPDKFNLYNENGEAVVKYVGGHWMTITGVTDDGRYIVYSWGKRYYLNPSELDNQDFFITDITRKRRFRNEENGRFIKDPALVSGLGGEHDLVMFSGDYG